MSHFLIVGQKLSSLTDYLTDNGHTYTFLQDRAKTKFPDKRFKHRVVTDFGSRASLIEVVDTLPHKVDGILTTYENYVLPAAWIATHLGLPGMPVSAAEACTDKFLMRSLFAKAPEKISPDFAIVKSEEDLQSFATTHKFPLILKPANLAKSLLVTKNDTLDELLSNYRKAMDTIDVIYKRYAPNRTPSLLIEEFLEGSIHSVDAFVDQRGTPMVIDAVVDYQTGYDIGFADNFHYSRLLPSRLSATEQQALRRCAAAGITALGMQSSAAHVEVIMTNEGPRIVEIGARNGGYRERMHKLANDIDVAGAALAIALGDTPSIQTLKDSPCAVIELFPKHPGVFSHIRGLERLQRLPSLSYLSVKAKPGAFVGKASDGYKMCAVAILFNEDWTQFEHDLDFFNSQVAVETT